MIRKFLSLACSSIERARANIGSKAELAIANLLFSKNICYKYEDRLHSKGKIEWKLPDFTVKTGDGDVYYWEHLGRLENDPNMLKIGKKRNKGTTKMDISTD